MSRSIFTSVVATPVAKLGIRTDSSVITGISWLTSRHTIRQPRSDLSRYVHRALVEYFHDGIELPRLALDLRGTPFQLSVWNTLMNIPMGTVISYGELAKLLNTSSRAVGQACRTNPVVLFVPCHRVVAIKGIGGYMGKQRKINIKQWLLNHEGAVWQ